MYAISMFLIQLFSWQILYSDVYDDNDIDDQHNSSAYDQYDSFVYMCNFIVCITYHMFLVKDLFVVWHCILVQKQLWVP